MVDIYILDLLVIGALLFLVTLGSGWISRLPLSYALIYLVVGVLLGPYGFKLIQVRPDAEFLERLTEFVVIVSLFSCGLKMNRPLQLWAWASTARMIGFLMPISIGAIAAVGHWLLGLGWAASVLLGGILAPTDPVLASEVQLNDVEDQDELRFALTSEGGLNDALAFPFVYFGLYWLKDGQWENWLHNWMLVDLLWAIAAGIGMGILVAQAVVRIDRKVQRLGAMDESRGDFVAISTILLTYSLTEVVNGYGFLAVFVAGLVIQHSSDNPEKPASQRIFIEKLEMLMEVGTIVLLGSLLRVAPITRFGTEILVVAGLIILVIRPLGAWISTIGAVPAEAIVEGVEAYRNQYRYRFHPATRWLLGWFGIRGVGSLYYLAYALGEGLQGPEGEAIAWITYATVAISVIIHGITSTPLMKWYEHHVKTRILRRQSLQSLESAANRGG